MAKARFFYALRPDAAAADALAALAARAAARWGGRAFAADDIHLTLAYVGMRPVEERSALEALLRGLPIAGSGDVPRKHDAQHPEASPARGDARAPGALVLSRLGSFGHGVLWIGPPAAGRGASPAGVFAHELASAIRARLRAAGIAFDERPLKLHATLVRGAHAFGRDAHAAGNEAPGSLVPSPIVARRWSLALGASDAGSTPQRRYRWSMPADAMPADAIPVRAMPVEPK